MILPKGHGQVVFRMKDVELVSQLIDGTFPDYQQIIPRSYKSRTILPTPALLKACKQAEIFAREGSNVARLDIKSAGDLEPGSVEISAQSEETGSNETVVAATIEGIGLLIAFNVKYLREVLEVILPFSQEDRRSALFERVQAEVKSEIEKAVDFALSAPFPDSHEAGEDVYA